MLAILAKIVFSLLPIGALLILLAGVIQLCGRHDIADYFGYTGVACIAICGAGTLVALLTTIWLH